MSKVRSRDNKAELLLRKEIWSRGYRYRLHLKRLIGKPDLVFSNKHLIVFVDGDFWHGRALIEEGVKGLKKGLRTDRADWWIEKIEKTIRRDKWVNESLENEGWKVLRFWESEIIRNCTMIADSIENHLESDPTA